MDYNCKILFLLDIEDPCQLTDTYLGGYATGNRIAFSSLADAKFKCVTGNHISLKIGNILITLFSGQFDNSEETSNKIYYHFSCRLQGIDSGTKLKRMDTSGLGLPQNEPKWRDIYATVVLW